MYVRGAWNVEQLFVFFFLLGSSTNRSRRVPRGLVGSSMISDERWAVRISVTPFSLFQLWVFLVVSGDCELTDLCSKPGVVDSMFPTM